jgi:hypothetical protein
MTAPREPKPPTPKPDDKPGTPIGRMPGPGSKDQAAADKDATERKRGQK